MNTQIKNIEIVEDFIHATVVVNGIQFHVTAPVESKTDWVWSGEDNWSVTEANAYKAGVEPDQLVQAITIALT